VADDRDAADKTEEPTHKRLEDARRKGQAAISREANHWLMILAATIAVGLFAPPMLNEVKRLLLPFIESPDRIATDIGSLQRLMLGIAWGVLLAGIVPLALTIVAAIAPHLLQHGWVISAEQMKPKFSKISPLSGARRMFSGQAVGEFLKAVTKLAVTGSIVIMLLWPLKNELGNLPALETSQVLDLAWRVSMRLLGGILAVMAVLAILDILYQKFAHRRRLRMTRAELREEFKQSEGDPIVKSRLRQIRMERARRRMMAAVPAADVVVTNPTHYAVALKYDPETMAAPRVTAKGADRVAQRIRDLAREHDVPIVENPPLARGLFEAVDIDQEIPPDHYKAVAEIIGFVMKLRRKVGAARKPAPPGLDHGAKSRGTP
jgi:flagellar biosynthetic protein FlhB